MNDELVGAEQAEIDRIILAALAEDIGDGDVTTDNTIAADSVLRGEFLPRPAAWWPAWRWRGARSSCLADASSGRC